MKFQIVLLITYLIFIGCASNSDSSPNANTIEELQSNKAKWQSQNILDYTYDIVANCGECQIIERTVTVENGVAVSFASNNPRHEDGDRLSTIKELFDEAISIVENGDDDTHSFVYNNDFGYPEEANFFEIGDQTDNGGGYLIYNFTLN